MTVQVPQVSSLVLGAPLRLLAPQRRGHRHDGALHQGVSDLHLESVVRQGLSPCQRSAGGARRQRR